MVGVTTSGVGTVRCHLRKPHWHSESRGLRMLQKANRDTEAGFWSWEVEAGMELAH